MLLQRLRGQAVASAATTATSSTSSTHAMARRRRRLPLSSIPRALSSTSSSVDDDLLLASTVPSSSRWGAGTAREEGEAMLPQPQYEGDHEITPDEEEADQEEDSWEAEGRLQRMRPPSASAFAAAGLNHTTATQLGKKGAMRCPALVLNQDHSPLTLFPLTIAPWHSAVRNALRGRLNVLASYERQVRSTHAVHQLPSVVCLTRQQEPSHNHFTTTEEGGTPPASRIPPPYRRNVFLRDSYTCCFCGQRLGYKALTLDHVVPRCLGGEDTWDNLASACQHCNARKGSLRVSELGQINMSLQKRPFTPTAIELAYAYIDLLPTTILHHWDRYLEEPLAKEAAKLRSFHSAFSLSPAVAAAAGGRREVVEEDDETVSSVPFALSTP